MPLTMTQDAVAPLGAFFIDMISAILLALTAVEPPLALSSPAIVCMFIVPFLGYASNGGMLWFLETMSRSEITVVLLTQDLSPMMT
jgi:hypothetical protein